MTKSCFLSFSFSLLSLPHLALFFTGIILSDIIEHHTLLTLKLSSQLQCLMQCKMFFNRIYFPGLFNGKSKISFLAISMDSNLAHLSIIVYYVLLLKVLKIVS
jgi:hypothetical protein